VMSYLVHVNFQSVVFLFFCSDDSSECTLMVVILKQRIVPWPLLRGADNFIQSLYESSCRDVQYYVKKVKCTVVQALRLCTCRTAHRGSRGIALL
jgi:hypothetical protein